MARWAKRRYKVLRSGLGNFKGITDKPYWVVVGPGLRMAPNIYERKLQAYLVALDLDAAYKEGLEQGRKKP